MTSGCAISSSTSPKAILSIRSRRLSSWAVVDPGVDSPVPKMQPRTLADRIARALDSGATDDEWLEFLAAVDAHIDDRSWRHVSSSIGASLRELLERRVVITREPECSPSRRPAS